MPLTKASFAVINVAGTITSTTVGNSTSIPSITFDQNGVISAVSNVPLSTSYLTGSNNGILTTNTSITGNVTIAPNTGGLTIGPVVISANQTVTVSANARWVVL